MGRGGGGGTPLPCRNSGDGGDMEVGGHHFPIRTRGLRGARAQPTALGCWGGRVSPRWGSGLRSPHGQRRNRQCQGGIRLIFWVLNPPTCLWWVHGTVRSSHHSLHVQGPLCTPSAISGFIQRQSATLVPSSLATATIPLGQILHRYSLAPGAGAQLQSEVCR